MKYNNELTEFKNRVIKDITNMNYLDMQLYNDTDDKFEISEYIEELNLIEVRNEFNGAVLDYYLLNICDGIAVFIDTDDYNKTKEVKLYDLDLEQLILIYNTQN